VHKTIELTTAHSEDNILGEIPVSGFSDVFFPVLEMIARSGN
jgi:hypothetical protein